MQLRIQGTVNKVLRKALPSSFRLPLRWDSYKMADAVIASTGWEAWIMRTLFDVPENRLHIVPTGVDNVFFKRSTLAPRPSTARASLVSVATITERKRIQELAEAAILAKVPIQIIGKPYSEHDPYYLQFLDIVKSSEGIVSYAGEISDAAQLAPILQSARGFVLLSTMETQSTAALAAAAAGCPLLLSDLPWARDTFGDNAIYFSVGSIETIVSALKSFYAVESFLAHSTPPHTWSEVARQLIHIYSAILPSGT